MFLIKNTETCIHVPLSALSSGKCRFGLHALTSLNYSLDQKLLGDVSPTRSTSVPCSYFLLDGSVFAYTQKRMVTDKLWLPIISYRFLSVSPSSGTDFPSFLPPDSFHEPSQPCREPFPFSVFLNSLTFCP